MVRLLSLLLSLLMLLPLYCPPAAAEETLPKRLTNKEGFVYIVKEDDTAEIVGYTGHEKKLTVPGQLDGYPVTAIGEKAFYNNAKLTELTVSKGIKTIGRRAFQDCRNLKSVILPEGLTELVGGPFEYCLKLKSINLPDSIQRIDGSPFSRCKALTDVTLSADHPCYYFADGVLFSREDHRLLWYPPAKKGKSYQVPEGTEAIDTEAFSGTNLSSVSIPESVTKIGKEAFYDDANLKEINIPSQVVDLNGVFYNCKKLATIRVSADNPVYESKGGVLFQKQEHELVYYPAGKSGKQYQIPDGTRSIGERAFDHAGFTEVTIPGSVETIKDNAFAFCRKLKTVSVPEGTVSLGRSVFQWCDSLTSVTLPASLKEIGQAIFVACKKLKSVRIADHHPALVMMGGALVSRQDMRLIWYPQAEKAKTVTVADGVKVIDRNAFVDCTRITEIILPESVTEIRWWAFAGCKKLKRVILPDSIVFIDKDAFRKQGPTGGGGNSFIDAVYVVRRGSYAEEFCKAYGLKTEYID